MISGFPKSTIPNFPKTTLIHFWGVFLGNEKRSRMFLIQEVDWMRKKNFKGRCEKRMIGKCTEVCRTYDVIQYAYADLLQESDETIDSETAGCFKGVLAQAWCHGLGGGH